MSDNLILDNCKVDYASNAKAVVVFAHGAGADMNHHYLNDLVNIMNAQQISVLRFNFPYMVKRQVDGKRRPPDRMPTLLACYKKILTDFITDLPIYIGGKSMGGRVAATLANEQSLIDRTKIRGVICLGYPFHPVKKPENLRLAPLQDTRLPILILQGDRDALGNELEISRYDISQLCRVHYFEDGDHDLKPRVKSGFNLKQHQITAVEKIGSFIDEINTSC